MTIISIYNLTPCVLKIPTLYGLSAMSKCIEPENEQTETEHHCNSLSRPISDIQIVANDVSQTGDESICQTQKGFMVQLSSTPDSILLADETLEKNNSNASNKKPFRFKGRKCFPSLPYLQKNSSSSTGPKKTKRSIKEKLKHRFSKQSSKTTSPPSTNGLNSEPNSGNLKDEQLPIFHATSYNENTSDGNLKFNVLN